MPSQDQQIIQFGPYRNKDILTQIDTALSTATVDVNGVATKVETANTESSREFSAPLLKDKVPELVDGGEINFTIKQWTYFSYIFDKKILTSYEIVSGALPPNVNIFNKYPNNAHYYNFMEGAPNIPGQYTCVVIIKDTSAGTKYKLNFNVLAVESQEEVTPDGLPEEIPVTPPSNGGNGGDGTVDSTEPGSGGTPSYDYWKPKYFTVLNGKQYRFTFTTQSWEKIVFGVNYLLILNIVGTWSYVDPVNNGTESWETNGKFAIVNTSSISGYNTTTGKIPNGATFNKPVNTAYNPQSNFITFGTSDPHTFSLRVPMVSSPYDFSLDSFGSPIEFSLVTDYVDYSRISAGSNAGNNSYIVGAFNALVHS
jgi:hypothetical protein